MNCLISWVLLIPSLAAFVFLCGLIVHETFFKRDYDEEKDGKSNPFYDA